MKLGSVPLRPFLQRWCELSGRETREGTFQEGRCAVSFPGHEPEIPGYRKWLEEPVSERDLLGR